MTIAATPHCAASLPRQLVTFRCGTQLLGLDICWVQEINRQLDMTPVPGSPPQVYGALNLRGEVVTVINLRFVFGLTENPSPVAPRIVIVQHNGELIGLLVDEVSDIVDLDTKQIAGAPANLRDVDERFLDGVYILADDVLAILNLDEVLTMDRSATG